MKLVTLQIGSYRLLPFYVWAVQRQHSQSNSMWRPQRPFRTSGSQYWNGRSSQRKDDNKASQHTSTAFRELDICRTNMFNWFNWTSQSCGSRKTCWKKDGKKRPNNGGTYKINGGCRCWQRKLRVVLWICLRAEIRYVIFTYLTLPVAHSLSRRKRGTFESANPGFVFLQIKHGIQANFYRCLVPKVAAM